MLGTELVPWALSHRAISLKPLPILVFGGLTSSFFLGGGKRGMFAKWLFFFFENSDCSLSDYVPLGVQGHVLLQSLQAESE